MTLGPDGWLYVAVEGGHIVRLRPPAGTGDAGAATASDWQLEQFASTGGRPLGLAFAPAGATLPAGWTESDLVVADAYIGLLRIDRLGEVELLTDEAAGRAIRYADGVDIDSQGIIYFTDASTRFGAKDYGGTFAASVLDILEHSGSGRLLRYDPHQGTTEELRTGLNFPNGVALSRDEQALFVAETGSYRILRYPIAREPASAGDGSDELEVVIDNLPGYPDNIRRGADGRYWCGLTRPRSALLDGMSQSPFQRKLVVRLPSWLRPIPPSYGHVFAFDERGTIVRDLQDPSGTYPSTTGAAEIDGRLYVQSLHAHGMLGYLDEIPAP
ncbi:MAG: SMP-30/gluconolactonase/LRE family protein [Haliangiales bacterium]